MPQIYLYAELLIHIRQLTLHASLQNEKNNDTKILLSFDKKVITVLHKGESASLYLPTQISGKANITFPTKKETDMSVRLVIEDESELVKAIDGREEGIEVPWCAKDLGETVVAECKNCANVLVEAGKVKEWKDLPSENWADLMDLWFCHKPHEVGIEDAAASKGFSAESKPGVATGVGLVDIMSLLLHKEDCKGVKVSSGATENSHKEIDMNDESSTLPTTGPEHLLCANCSSFVGSLPSTSENEGYRLYKSRLTITASPSASPEWFPLSIFIGAQLLHLIENNISRRVVIHSNTTTASSSIPTPTSPGILAWIFNPDIYYSSSNSIPDDTVHRAMKIFYETTSDPLSLLDSPTSSVEELLLPSPLLREFTTSLQRSTQIMPETARTFQDWNVGLIDRWERNPSGKRMMDGNVLNKKAPKMIKMKINEVPEGWSELFV